MAKRCKFCKRYEVEKITGAFGMSSDVCLNCGKPQKEKKGRAGQSLMPRIF